jgi:tetratricopeptide (TPR) repeat protein
MSSPLKVHIIMSRCLELLNVVFINSVACGWLCVYAPVSLAKPQAQPEGRPFNSLKITTPDPLLPSTARRGKLPAAEQQQVSQNADTLELQGTQAFKSGQKDTAFATWFRSLRLRQYLPPLNEISALGRVGTSAWNESRTTEIRMITERLQALEQGVTSPDLSSQDRLQMQRSLGYAYEQVHAYASAVAIYERVKAQARTTGDRTTEAQALLAIAELYFNRLDYAPSAAAYQELLTLVQKQGGSVLPQPTQRSAYNPNRRSSALMSGTVLPTELDILLQLNYLYEQSQQPEPGIAIQERLIAYYQQTQDPKPIPALRLTIAKNHQAANKPEQALSSYQQTYEQAVSLQQYAVAAEALQNLVDYYRSQNQYEAALKMYQYLFDVQMRSDNTMGQMETLDQMGQVYSAQKNYPQAIATFQKGLAIAKQLNYRQDYFAAQIQQASQQQTQ